MQITYFSSKFKEMHSKVKYDQKFGPKFTDNIVLL